MKFKATVALVITSTIIACASTQKSSQQRHLQADDILLLEAATRIQEAVGADVWPDFGAFKTAVLFQSADGQVLLNAVNPPSEFTPYFHQTPYWGSPAFTTNGLRAFDGNSLSKEEYQTGFFASAYSSTQTGQHFPFSVFVLDSIGQFHKKGNPWSVEDWMSIFWHEVFHNFQDTRYQTGFPSKEVSNFKNVKPLLGDEEYLRLIKSELKLVSDGLKAVPGETKKQILCKGLAKSRAKRALFLKAKKLTNSLKSEQFYETSEGTARYVEEMILLAAANYREISKVTANIPSGPNFSDFKKYKERTLSDYYDRIKVLHPGERYFYQTGFSVALALDQLAPNWKSSVFVTDGGIYAVLQKACAQ